MQVISVWQRHLSRHDPQLREPTASEQDLCDGAGYTPCCLGNLAQLRDESRGSIGVVKRGPSCQVNTYAGGKRNMPGWSRPRVCLVACWALMERHTTLSGKG